MSLSFIIEGLFEGYVIEMSHVFQTCGAGVKATIAISNIFCCDAQPSRFFTSCFRIRTIELE